MQSFEMKGHNEDLDDTHISLIHRSPLRNFLKWNNPKFRLFLYLSFIFIIVIIIIISLTLTIKHKTSINPVNNEPILINKPYNDIRSYYSYTLDNGLQTIFIIDPSCTNPGAALSVNAGTKQDGHINGIAHLLEHVLFMGSEKYPIEDHFFNRISLFNGDTNAYTSNEVTAYYWTINNNNEDIDEFEEILDIWANFFINPLISEDKVLREINAVNSEYLNSLINPDYRIYHIMKLMMNPSSVNSKFSCGNLESFQHESFNLTEELIKFFKKHYTPSDFHLVLIGNYTLKQLKEKTEKVFNSLQNLKISQEITQEESISPNSAGYWKGKLAKYQRIQGKELVLAWILPELLSKYKVNPLEYWLDLINSEHEGSLILSLKEMGLIEGISATAYSYEIDGTFFNIHIKLTEGGFHEINTILQYVMKYIKLISEVGITRQKWENMKIIRDLTYNYTYKNNEIDEISNIVGNMRFIPKEDIIDVLKYTANIFQEYSYEEIYDIYNFISLDQALLVVGHENYNNISISSQKVLKTQNLSYFQDFFLGNFSDIYAMQWDSTEWSGIELYTIDDKNSFDLKLPPNNLYIPKNLTMPCKNPYLCEDSEVNEDISTQPSLIASSENHEIWYKMQRNFNKFEPKASFHIKIKSPYTYNSSKSVFLGHLARKWLKWHFKPLFQQLENLGYSIDFGYKLNFELKIYGFAESLVSIANELGQIIKNCSKMNFIAEKPHIFSLLKNMTLQKVHNKLIKGPLGQAKHHLKILLSKYRYNYTEMENMQNLTIEEFSGFFQNFIQNNFIDGLIFGALDKDMALSIWLNFNSSNINSNKADNLPHYQCLKLNDKKTFVQLNKNQNDVNSAILSYFDLGVNLLDNMGKYLILADYFNSKAFDYLRTKLQLGYMAGTKPMIYNGIMGFVIYLQGKTNNITIFEQKNEEFLENFIESITELSDDEFVLMRKSKINELLFLTKAEDKEKEYWQIIEGNLTNHWNIKEMLSFMMLNINKVSVIEYWKDIIVNKEETGRLNIEVVTEDMKSYYENSEYKNYDDFRGEMYEEVTERINLFQD